MRVALFTGPFEKLKVEEVTPLPLDPGNVLVRTTASGLCHSDLLPLIDELPRKEPQPSVIGHEGAGVVEEIGPGVHHLKPGDRVICTFVRPCLQCFFCVRGKTELCENQAVEYKPKFQLGDGTDVYSDLGTFSEAMIVEERSLVKVETDLPDEQLALLGCGLTTGVFAALNSAEVQAGSSVAVVGLGGVGQSVIQGARVAGAQVIIAIDPIEMKREAAKELGATHTIDPTDGDPVEAVRELTGGRGVDYSFEVAGRADTGDQCFELTRSGGTLVLVGAQPLSATPGWSSFKHLTSEKRVVGGLFGGASVMRDIPKLVGMIEAGQIDVESMISRRIGLDEINDGLDAIEGGTVIRSVLVP